MQYSVMSKGEGGGLHMAGKFHIWTFKLPAQTSETRSPHKGGEFPVTPDAICQRGANFWFLKEIETIYDNGK